MIPRFLRKLILYVIIKVRITELFDKPWILMRYHICTNISKTENFDSSLFHL